MQKKGENMKAIIEELWKVRDTLTPDSLREPEIKKAILDVIDELDNGKIKVAHKNANEWLVNEWVKKAILIYVIVARKYVMSDGSHKYFDKLPLKFDSWDQLKFESADLRVSIGAIVRKGAFISNGSILKPSFIGIGTHIGDRTFIDTYSNIGVCTQIGKHCNIGTHVNLVGGLEPISSLPTIIEDNCHIGSHCSIGNGVIIREGAILNTGVHIDKTTKIYDRESGVVFYGEVPPYSVVTSGVLPSADGTLFTYAAIIMDRTDEDKRTRFSVDKILKEVK